MLTTIPPVRQPAMGPLSAHIMRLAAALNREDRSDATGRPADTLLAIVYDAIGSHTST